MTKEALIELRKSIKAKKPDFVRESSHKVKSLGKHWRKPKGLHSKMRRRRHGKPSSVEPGHGSPSEVRNLHKSGLLPILINSVGEIEQLGKNTHGAIIGTRVGAKKRILLLEKLKEKNIRALNIKDTDAYISKVQDKIKKLKTVKQETAKKKESKKAEKPSKKELTEKVSEESEKEQKKKELDKVLTKREK